MDGVIVLNKPVGRTSHYYVNFVRKLFNIKKVGHTGTLDPDASGVLPICIGRATKAADMLTASDKAYRAQLVFGMTTDTQDASGEVLTEQPACVKYSDFEKIIEKFIGEIEQIPPMFSAIKKDGKKLYELAREGISIEREKRKVRIDKIELLEFDQKRGTAKIDVECSKGTYIRTLCEDIGMDLGCGAYMNSLVRTKSGMFKIEDSYTTAQIEDAVKNGELEKMITPVSELFAGYPKVYLNDKKSELVKNGVRIKYSGLDEGQCYRLFDQAGKFLSVSRFTDNSLVLEKAFWNDK